MANCDETRISEKRFYAIPAQALTADGTVDGTITIAKTFCWKVGQIITCVSSTVQPRRLKIKAVLSETTIKVGEIDTPIYKFTDVSSLLVADTAMIELHDDYDSNRRPVIDLHEIQRQVYEEEPTIALRSHLVDWLGRSYCVDNPIPVQLSDGSIDIGTVNAELEVQLSHQDNVPDAGDVADSVQIGDGVEILEINPDGSINVDIVDVKVPKVVRIAVPLADTEYSYTFTTATKRFKFRVEDSAAKARIAWVVTETATHYWDVNRGSYYEDRDLDLSAGVTIYYRLNKASKTVQIQYWE